MTLGQVLDRERARQSLTYYALAKSAGLTPSRLTAICDGTTLDPRFDTVSKILAALGKGFGWLEKELAK